MPAITATARTATTTADRMPLDAPLGSLERAAARLPHAFAVPVMVVHAALASIVYR